MRVRGAELVVRALRDGGVRRVFGIPGTHNIELWDALERSSIEPVLVADERSGAFLADGLARSSDEVAVLALVPGAGATHAASGIAEAFLDQVPVTVLATGIRTDTGAAYQLHDIDQMALLAPVVRAAIPVREAVEIYPAVRRALELARSGVPGPVVVEVPANLLMLTQRVGDLRYEPEPWRPPEPEPGLVEEVARRLNLARRPLLYVGWGARRAVRELLRVAEALRAPVATTIQGKGVFPEDHPLFLWNGLGAQAPPFVRRIARAADCVLAVGCRFAEVATGSYGFELPPELIHVDLDPAVPGRNYPVSLAVTADAHAFLAALAPLLDERPADRELEVAIADGHAALRRQWRRRRSEGRVTPAALFEALAGLVARDAIFVTDSGNGTFLAMEHLRLGGPGRFLAPVDFSAMGYAVPAAMGAKLAHPGRDVVALPGDGAFLMTGTELATAAARRLGVLVVVLRDGKLNQIAQFQRIPLGRETCTRLPAYSVTEVARGLGCEAFAAAVDGELGPALEAALEAARAGRPAVVEVALDPEVRTWFTRGVVRTNFFRLPPGDRVRMLARAVARRIRRP